MNFYTYLCVFTSNTPRVVMRRLGITGSAMKLSVMNGSIARFTPRRNASSFAASRALLTISRLSSDMMPAMGSATSPSTAPPSITVMPPRFSTIRFAAAAISSSDAPTTMMLWLSWLMEVATAPCVSP